MASDKAKELAAKQKAQAKAEKARRKNSTDPRDWGQMRQITETYKMTREQDPKLGLVLLASFLLPIIAFTVLGLIVKPLVMWIILGVSVGMAIATWMFVRRVKAATYKKYEGQAGSAEVALNLLDKKWVKNPAITATRQLDVVHRVIGPGGLVLIGEGSPARLKQLLATEAKRHEQATFNTKVVTVQMGDGPGQVPLNKLTDHIRKLPKQLTDDKIADINNRLRGLDAVRPRMPIPKGPISTKGARQAMRGR